MYCGAGSSTALQGCWPPGVGDESLQVGSRRCKRPFAGLFRTAVARMVQRKMTPYKCHFLDCNFAAPHKHSLAPHWCSAHTGDTGAVLTQARSLTSATARAAIVQRLKKATWSFTNAPTLGILAGSRTRAISRAAISQRLRRLVWPSTNAPTLGERPCKCDFPSCNFAARTTSHLVIHKRTHTAEKHYKCDFLGCKHASTAKAGLVVHQPTRIGEKPYKRNLLRSRAERPV